MRRICASAPSTPSPPRPNASVSRCWPLCDSPVAGGSGTVEILAHLRFAGRPESMPRPGERKPARARSQDSHGTPSERLRWFAVASPGLEEPLARGAGCAARNRRRAGRRGRGGILRSRLAAGMAANLGSRIATRVLVRMGEVKARDFAPLRRSLAKFPWRSFIPVGRALRIDVSTSHCRLYHTGALADTLSLAIEDCVGKLPARDKSAEASPHQRGRSYDAHSAARAGRPLQSQAWIPRARSCIGAAGAWRPGPRLCAKPWPRASWPSANTIRRGRSWIPCAARAPSPSKPRPGRAGSRRARAAPSPSSAGPATTRRSGRRCARRSGKKRRQRGPSSPPIATRRRWRWPERNAARADVAGRHFASRSRLSAMARSPTRRGSSSSIPLRPSAGAAAAGASPRRAAWADLVRRATAAGEAAVLCPDPTFVAAVAAGARRKPAQTHMLRNGGLRVHLGLWELL